MCCDTMCGAQSEGCRIADCAPGVQSLCVDSMSQVWGTKAAWCGVEASMTSTRIATRRQ